MTRQAKYLRVFIVIFFCLWVSAYVTADASECIDNYWQPTFVHDNDCPDGPYYVSPGGGFTKLQGNTEAEWIPQACQLIQQYGLRDMRGFTNCAAYTRVQCGCRRGMSEGNTACASFLAGRPMSSRGQCGGPGTRPAACQTQRTMNQPESRDASGRITVEASVIHVMSCQGAGGPIELYIYQYVNRPGYRVIRPPHWGNAIGGKDFPTFQEAQSVASQVAGSGGATPPPQNQPRRCPDGSIDLLGICSQGTSGR